MAAVGRITVVGIGRLGLCFALNLERAGYDVIGYDIREDYIKEVNNKTFSSSEPQLNSLLKSSENFEATSSLKYSIESSDIIFVIVRTDSDEDGKYNHDQIESFIEKLKTLGRSKKKKHIVICSNVQPGYTNTVANRLNDYNYKVSFNPETIAQGRIIEDQVYPSIVVIGQEDQEAGDEIINVYRNMCKSDYTIHRMDRTSAELAKVGLNCSVTAKISMANTIGDVAVRLGADPDLVLEAIGSDSRIGNKYFKYGFGYGGPCFPRDNRAFIRSASQVGIDAHMNIACDETNKDHLKYQIEDFCEKNKKEDPIVITDVSYKKGFDMIEESQQLEFALGIAKLGYNVTIKESAEVIQSVWFEHGDIFKYEVIK